jgi:hypothetical protein
MRGTNLVLFLVIFLSHGIVGQIIVPKNTINVEVGLPVVLANKPFKGMMQGLVNISGHYQYTLSNSLCFGIGGIFSYFTINEFKVPSKISGGMQTFGGFVKIGREKFHTEQFATDMGIKMGYAITYFSTTENEKFGQNPVIIESPYLCPTIGLALAADEFTSYRLSIGYVIQGFRFQPGYLGFQSDAGYDVSTFKRFTQYLSIGFGYTYYFK